MSEYCNPMKCTAYASGWCEYDFATGRIMPMDPNCPLLKEEKNERYPDPLHPLP